MQFLEGSYVDVCNQFSIKIKVYISNNKRVEFETIQIYVLLGIFK